MKHYKHLVESLPSKTIVFAFGRFNPPTTGHELLVKFVKKVAQLNRADYVIYASRTQDSKKNPLSVERKLHYLNLMFPNTHFVGATDEQRTFIEVAKHLNQTYKRLIMIAGSDRVPEYQQLLNKYNGKEFDFDSIKVMSAGERDPDADDVSGMSASKLRALATKGDFDSFKKGMPLTVREIDARRLMNDIRQGLNLEPIKEQIAFGPNDLRSKYINNEIFNVGDLVESNNETFEILDRGTNYLVVVDQVGNTHRKWLTECVPVVKQVVAEDIHGGYAPSEITFKGYTTKNLHHSADAAHAFEQTIGRLKTGQVTDPVAVLNALKATDKYMKLNDMHLEQGKMPDEKDLAAWRDAHTKARDALERIGEFMHHQDYWHMHDHELQDMIANYTPETAGAEMADSYKPQNDLVEELTDKTIKSSDKIKVARVIADMLGVENVESMSPEAAVNAGLRKIRMKRMTPELVGVVRKMLSLAHEVGLKVDTSLVPKAVEEQRKADDDSTEVDTKSTYNAASDIVRYKDFVHLLNASRGHIRPSDIPTTEIGGENPTEVGHTLDTGDRDHLRRMKAVYRTEEVEDQSDIDEDVQSADYKINPETGRKYRARHITFAASRQTDDEDQDDEDEDKNSVKEDIQTATFRTSPTGRKVHAGHINFAASKSGGAPAQTGGSVQRSKPVNNEPVIKPAAKPKRLVGKPFESVEHQQDDFDMSEDDLDKLVSDVDDTEDILHAYDDNELVIVDHETGDKIADLSEQTQLNEVLSRIERIRAKMRFAKTEAKRKRKVELALKTRSSPSKINQRARRLAIHLLKRAFAQKSPDQMTVGEKERVERMVEKRRVLVDRLAMKLVGRVRKIENERLSHSKVTK